MDNKELDTIRIEIGKLRAEVNDIKENHLKHLREAVKWCNTKVNFILVGAGISLALTALILALMVAYVFGG